MKRRFLRLAIIGLSLLVGCGGGGGGGGGAGVNAVGVSVSPTTADLPVAGRQTFAATVTNTANTAVTWSVQEGTAGGAIATSGLYTAPDTAGTYHVLATSQADTAKSATAAITVHPVVSLTPPTATLTLRQSQTFTAQVLGTTNQAVTWSLQEGAAGGTITSGGLYTAANAPGTYHAVAVIQADPAQTATATITVQAGSASGTIQ